MYKSALCFAPVKLATDDIPVKTGTSHEILKLAEYLFLNAKC